MSIEGGGFTKSMGGERRGLLREPVTPGVAFIEPFNLWNYEPRGPEYMVHVHALFYYPRGVYLTEVYDSLDHALDRFADVCLPMIFDHAAYVLDSRGVTVLRYAYGETARAAFGPMGDWLGVQRPFEMLAERWDPMEVAVWETMAREHPLRP